MASTVIDTPVVFCTVRAPGDRFFTGCGRHGFLNSEAPEASSRLFTDDRQIGYSGQAYLEVGERVVSVSPRFPRWGLLNFLTLDEAVDSASGTVSTTKSSTIHRNSAEKLAV